MIHLSNEKHGGKMASPDFEILETKSDIIITF